VASSRPRRTVWIDRCFEMLVPRCLRLVKDTSHFFSNFSRPSPRQLMRRDPRLERGHGVSCCNCLATASESADTRIAPTAVCSGARSSKHLKHETWIFPNRLNRRITGGPTVCGSHSSHSSHSSHTSHTSHSSQLTAHSPQPTAHSPQPTAHSPQPTAHSPQPTAHSSQLTAHSSQLTQLTQVWLLNHVVNACIAVIGF
jgi:hypothetical protein